MVKRFNNPEYWVAEEVFTITQSMDHSELSTFLVDKLTAFTNLMYKNHLKYLNATVKIDDVVVGYIGNTITDELLTVAGLLNSLDSDEHTVVVTFLYDFVSEKSEFAYLASPKSSEDFYANTDDIGFFYMSRVTTDPDFSLGDLKAYGKFNGKLYNGFLDTKESETIPECHSWLSISEVLEVVLDSEQFKLLSLEKKKNLMECCEALGEFGEYSKTSELEEGEFYFHLESLSVQTDAEVAEFFGLIKQLAEILED